MASAINKISQIVRLKRVMQRWRDITLKRRPVRSCSNDESDKSDSKSNSGGRITPPGCLAVYVGPARRRFVIPTRFLNLPVFVSLLNQAEEEFGFQTNGGLALPCAADFFASVVEFLERDEERYRGLGLDEFCRLFSEVGLEYCKDPVHVCSFTPLLQKTRV